MYATFRYYADGSTLVEALREREDDVRRVIGEVQGVRGYYLVHTGDSAVTVTVTDDEAGAEESSRVAAAWIAENLPGLAISPPQISSGKVVIAL
jgi:hypothetical protein